MYIDEHLRLLFMVNSRHTRLLLPTFLILLQALSTTTLAEKSPCDWALIRLDYVRQEKVTHLQSFCDRMHALATQAINDDFMVASFDINLQYTEAMKKSPVPEALTKRVSELRNSFNGYYIQNYFAFYNILFVNTQGKVFYSIREDPDLKTNILNGDGKYSPLAERLRKIPEEEVFVDFHRYGSSSKPAAFFIEPIYKDDTRVGWVILQCVINKINTLFAWTDDLGQTGETFLVNQEGYMLTESNFEGASTILKKHLDDRNIQRKFADKQGHRTVIDYRGRTALTSFAVVEFLGTKWLVVAKMDTDEIITDHYIQHNRYYADKILAHLKSIPLAPLRNTNPIPAKETLQVDMDEFLRADGGERLYTFGVSTCTGVLAAYPGKLAYLAHISPKDKLYGSDDTNLLGPMIKRIKVFDIYRCERQRVVFVVVATHLNTILAIVDKLVEEGFFLSQIMVMYNPEAKSATINYDYSQNDLIITWRLDENTNHKHIHTIEDTVNVGNIVQQFMNVEDKAKIKKECSEGISIRPINKDNRVHIAVTEQEGGSDMCVTRRHIL